MNKIRAVLAAGLSLLSCTAAAQNVTKHPGRPAGIILESVSVRPGAAMLYVSGQLASPIIEADTRKAVALSHADFEDTRTQTISALGKVKAILIKRGYSLGDIIKLTLFVVGDPRLNGRADIAGMNDGFKQFFGSSSNPSTVARSAIQVSGLVGPEYLIEIEAVAAK